MIKTVYLIAFALSICVMACQTGTKSENTPALSEATLHWTGEVAADGCGFEIELDGKRYLPADEAAIPDRFKNAPQTAVMLQYELLPKPIDRRCGMVPQPRIMPALRVLSVEAL